MGLCPDRDKVDEYAISQEDSKNFTKAGDDELLQGSETDMLESPCTPKDFFCHATIGKGMFAKVILVEKINTKGKLYAMKILKKQKLKELGQQENTKTERDILVKHNSPFLI